MGGTSLRRSCGSCIRAKHRCSRQLPCVRCARLQLACRYDNEPWNECVANSADEAVIFRIRCPNRPQRDIYISELTADMMLNACAHGVEVTLDRTTLAFLTDQLHRIPASFVEGKTPFIHGQLYRTHMPAVIRDAGLVCRDESLLEAKLAALVQAWPSAVSIPAKLAACHALLLYQIILLGRGGTNVRLLHDWTMDLWHAAPGQLEGDSWDVWVLAESVRRTILMAYLVQGVFRVVQFGHTRHTLFAASLPFDSRTWLWEAEQGVENEVAMLSSYREFTDQWTSHQFPLTGAFEVMLVAACRGVPAIEAYGNHMADDHHQRERNDNPR